MATPAERARALPAIERNVVTMRGQGMTPTEIANEMKGGMTAERVDELLIDIVFALQGIKEPTPEQLRDLATREHIATVRASQSVLEHAIASGLALERAKRLVAHGEWDGWCQENLAMPRHTARNYMRIARHRSAVRAAAIKGVGEALNMIAEGLPRDADAEIRRVAAAKPETPRQEIAETVGVSEGQVRRVLDPAAHEDEKRRQREDGAERSRQIAEERAAAVHAFDERLGHAYDKLQGAVDDLRVVLERHEGHRRRRIAGVVRSAELALEEVMYLAIGERRGA